MSSEYVIKVGEILLKGGNRALFERRLKNNIERKLRKYNISVHGKQGRYFLESGSCDEDTIEKTLSTTFGIVGYAEVQRIQKDRTAIKRTAVRMVERAIAGSYGNSFKIEARRSDKSFELTSYQIASEIGQLIADTFPSLSVDVNNPSWILFIEIRDKALLYLSPKPGPGGLPVGCAGKGMLLLSGGIDSPVAGFLMAKRGLTLFPVYFHTYPYTSDEVLKKIKQLVRHLSPYLGETVLHVVPFTDIQIKLKTSPYEEEMTLLMRACMMKIADILAEKRKAVCLVTGEALSQVASQTAESLRFTQSMSSLPVLRPLIGMDKEEIIEKARTIGTYSTSTLPYEDCCTLFAPRHPLIKPDFEQMQSIFSGLSLDSDLHDAAGQVDCIRFSDMLD